MYHCQNVCHVLFVKRADYTGVDVNLLCFICNNPMATFLLIQPLVPLHVQGKKIVLHKHHPVDALLANFAQSYIKGGVIFSSLCSLHCDEVIATRSCCVTVSREFVLDGANVRYYF